jgi:hypothetical protein
MQLTHWGKITHKLSLNFKQLQLAWLIYLYLQNALYLYKLFPNPRKFLSYMNEWVMFI